MADYTRLQLRSFQTSSEDWSGTIGCTLINNNSSTAYFAMEGERYWDGNRFNYKDIFNSASLSNLVNCSVVSGSTNAGFIVNPMATASFDLTSTSTIGKNLLKFSAPNAVVYSLGDTTASGSLLGVGFSFDTISYLLDDYGSAAAAYSLRQLSSTYTGPAIKVQDNVGGATQDIGFDSNGELDTTALAAYGGSNDVFVETWYDQSGNSNDATQTSSSARPKIYDGTTGVVTENGKPAVEFDRSNDNHLDYSNSISNATNAIVVAKNTASSWGDITGQFGGSLRCLSNADWHASTNSDDFHYLGSLFIDGTQLSSGTIDAAFQRLIYANAATGGFSDSLLFIGLGYPNRNWDGPMQELIIYTSDQSATPTRTGIETNINTFYDIY